MRRRRSERGVERAPAQDPARRTRHGWDDLSGWHGLPIHHFLPAAAEGARNWVLVPHEQLVEEHGGLRAALGENRDPRRSRSDPYLDPGEHRIPEGRDARGAEAFRARDGEYAARDRLQRVSRNRG